MKRTLIAAFAVAALSIPLLSGCVPADPKAQYLEFVKSQDSGSFDDDVLLMYGDAVCESFEENGVRVVAIAAEVAREESQGDLPIIVKGAAQYLCDEYWYEYNHLGDE